jgi:truncated hemoglobin YjbI
MQGGFRMAKKHNEEGIPQHEIEALARCLLPEIRKFFESEEGQREFAEWKAK